MMTTRISWGPLVMLALASAPGVEGHADLLNVHGSGTTNPSKCYWSIMDAFENQAKHPVRMTYRAVGSTTGIAEFINGYQSTPANDFGSGDIPLNRTVYETFQQEGIRIIHLPVLLGAVSFFHSAPVDELKLNACLLARIFKREIVEWGHEDIVALNPDLEGVTLDITVARRVKGSSSTDSITRYLLDACPQHWPEELTGSRVDWPADTMPCEGSGGMTRCIQSQVGTIGYIDAGHGINAGLAEIELQNRDGTVQTSAQASERGGIAAAEEGVLPDNPDEDFSGVSLLNRPGLYTWPIVQMTFLYVRQNLTYFDDPDEQSLLVAFLRALFMEEYVAPCRDQYGFTLPSQDVVDFALRGINMLQTSPLSNEWFFETKTTAITATGDFVVSVKRQSIAEVERRSLISDIAQLEAQLAELEVRLEDVMTTAAASASSPASGGGLSGSDESQLRTALVLSILSLILTVVVLLRQTMTPRPVPPPVVTESPLP